MPKKYTARVVDGVLGFQEDGRYRPKIAVDTKAWFAWLANHEAFAYQDETGCLTVRCEQIKGKAAYWYAYR